MVGGGMSCASYFLRSEFYSLFIFCYSYICTILFSDTFFLLSAFIYFLFIYLYIYVHHCLTLPNIIYHHDPSYPCPWVVLLHTPLILSFSRMVTHHWSNRFADACGLSGKLFFYLFVLRGHLIIPHLGGGLKDFFMFTPKIGEDEPILTDIFQMGWFNHQLASCWCSDDSIRDL